MRKSLLPALSVVLALVVACAGNGETGDVAAPLKVDLEQVVAAGKVLPVGGITSAGQPDEKALRVFADSGYVAVIDLRTADEDRGLDEQVVVEGLGMQYVSLPIGDGDITFDKARKLDELIASYDEPVLVHCRSANRVGALLALRASLKGADDDQALAAGKAGGLSSLEKEVREVLRQQ